MSAVSTPSNNIAKENDKNSKEWLLTLMLLQYLSDMVLPLLFSPCTCVSTIIIVDIHVHAGRRVKVVKPGATFHVHLIIGVGGRG